jgi:CIC family chloride channel protein
MIRRTFQARGAGVFLAAALVVGVLVGVAAALLVLLIGWLRDLTEARVDQLGSWWWLVSVPAGILAAWAVARRFGHEVESGGVTETMTGLSIHGGYLSTRLIPAKLAATAVTLGTGGSGGREGPSVMIGGAIGSSLARYTRFGEDQIRSLIAAGAGAGIGASFAAPIAGMLFAMEVLLGNFAIRHLNAVVVASVAAAVTTRTIVGEERLLTAPPHSLQDPRELLLYTLLGIAAAAAAMLFLRILDAVAQVRARSAALPGWVRPVAAGLAVAIVGLVEADALGAGQEFVAGLLRLGPDTTRAAWVLLAVAVAKMATNALTRSGGGSGGTFMPSLFIGACLGAALAIVVGPAWDYSVLEPGAFAVVGMAATFSAVARAPLTAILIVFEITGDYELVLPLMLATSIATLLAERLHPESVYTMPLKRRGIHLLRREDIDLLDTVTVGEVMTWPETVPDSTMSTAAVDRILTDERHHGLPVVDDGELVGIVTVSDIARSGGPAEDLLVADVMTPDPITVIPTMPVSVALARMAALGFGRLPVVATEDPRRLVGMFRRESVVRAYHHALGATTDRHLYRERLRLRTHPGTGFFELPVPPGSAAHGRLVRELQWPEGATLVSVRRGDRVIIPHGDTVLATNDTITAFGTGESRVDLAYVLQPGPETDAP